MAKRFQLSYAPPMAVIVVVVVVLLMALPSISAHNKLSPRPSSQRSSDKEFVRKSCNVTPYPDICNSMVPMVSPSRIKQNPFQMIKSVVEFSKLSAEGLAILFGEMNVQVQQTKGLNPSTEVQNLLDVVKDCSSLFKAAVDLKLRAIKQMDQLNNPSSSSDCRVEMRHVETWLSAALTREDKCTKRLGSLSVHSKNNIMKKFNEAIVNTNMETKITSNALALAKDFLAHH